MEQNQNSMPGGSLEQLEKKVKQYLLEARDVQFVEYLQKLQIRIREQRHQTDLLQVELERAYQMYLRRTELTEEKVQQDRMEVQPPMEVRSVVPPKQSKNGMEFAIGTVLLSVVGGAFILTALVMLGMNYMNGFAKGICMYAGALAILLISELIIYRKWQKLSTVFSGIGIGGLYLVTVLNYLSLHIFTMWPAIIIVLIITLLVIVLSRTRSSAVYRALGIISCYLSLIIMKEGITNTEFIVLTAIIFVINLVYICIPLQKNQVMLGVLHIFTNLIFSSCMLWRGEKYGIALETRTGFILSMMVLMQVIYGTLLQYQKRQNEKGYVTNNTGISLAYGIGLFFNYAILSDYMSKGNAKYVIVVFLTVFLLVKILSFWKITHLRVHDAIMTAFCCGMLLGYRDVGVPYHYLLLAGVIISVLSIRQWQTYYEIILTYTIGFYAVQNIIPTLRLPVFAGIMFLGILVFHNVKRWKGRGIMVYNIFALLGEGICFLMLMAPVYRNMYFIYLFLLIFGLATIILTFQEKYQMNFKYKHLMLAGFLTYMALVVRIGVPIVNSILLMLIALVCVGMGFAIQKKSIRVYGLVLSLIICGKIVLYDYWGAATLQKMLLFFAVGVIALVISGIYIILEKKNNV